ncbi:MAG: carbohydrate kinase family protein [Candidatus Izemoplasmataceae bacterium]
MNALIIGGVSIDTLIYTPEIKHISSDMSIFAKKKTEQIGGTGVGKALMMSKLSTNTTLVCQAAKEDYDFINKTLVKNKIHPVILETNVTEKHTNIMHGENHRLSIFTSFPEDVNNINKVVTDKMLQEADIIFLNINSFCKPLIPRLYPYKEKIVVDLHDYDLDSEYHKVFLDVGSYLFSSCIYLKNQVDFLEDSLTKYNLKTSVITCNKEGALGMDDENRVISSEAIKGIKMVDSNGAGDAFVVGFIYEYLKSKNLEYALLFGNVCGAFSCESEMLINQDITISEIILRFNVEKNRLQ